ncbi:hypothetical protein CHU98_g5584 [Xylaria longipes]|nr:hypothetical protein CHU98_g5584 [Xylaria longipes]
MGRHGRPSAVYDRIDEQSHCSGTLGARGTVRAKIRFWPARYQEAPTYKEWASYVNPGEYLTVKYLLLLPDQPRTISLTWMYCGQRLHTVCALDSTFLPSNVTPPVAGRDITQLLDPVCLGDWGHEGNSLSSAFLPGPVGPSLDCWILIIDREIFAIEILLPDGYRLGNGVSHNDIRRPPRALNQSIKAFAEGSFGNRGVESRKASVIASISVVRASPVVLQYGVRELEPVNLRCGMIGKKNGGSRSDALSDFQCRQAEEARGKGTAMPAGRKRTEIDLGDSADATFSMDYLADPAPDSGTFMSTSEIPTLLGTDMDLLPDARFHLNNDFSSLLAPMSRNNSFLPDSWASQFKEISSVPREKTLADYAPWQLADPSSKAAFTMNALKNFHVKFAQNSCTPYIHRYLYKDNMPRCMLQAFTMCLLYTNQTESNRAIVLRVLHESVTDLKETTRNKALVPQQKLARVHALIFYQTIRMFDGDVTLGQQVDDGMALLDSWNNDLCKVRDNLDDLAEKGKAASEHPPESWEVWTMGPSLGYYKMITRSSHLWNAQNSFDFFRAWKEQPLYIISTFNFDDFLKSGTGDDLDEFAFYFLTIYFGVNEIKTFCHETSGHVLALT